MSEDDVVTEDKTFWWSNWVRVENLELIFSLISIGIVIFVIQEDLVNTNPTLFWIISILDLLIVGFFIAELATDLSTTDDRSEWWRAQSWGVLGLTPVILAAIPQISVIVLLRLVHLTKVYSLATNLLGLHETSEDSPVQRQIQHLLFVVTAIGFAGGFIAFLFEQQATADACGETCITTLPQSMWWAITTATTVGYGDYAPVTTGGRVVAIFLMFTGIALYGLLTATLSQLIWARGRKNQKMDDVSNIDTIQMIERLERLADMRRDGWLTATEFHDAKGFILNGKVPGSVRSNEIESRNPLPRDERKMRRTIAREALSTENEEE
ncbi:MAG: ion channel [Candidatus Thalassarchaeaceae archaeon]|jgi:voltage-gated potassium channel Kch|nr:ion channel [Candidatus Thalassarchaeaceae archaeon]